MQSLLSVMAGGALGAGLRFGVGLALPARNGWPWATFAVNIVGGLAMGLLAASLMKGNAGETARLFLGVGVLGGFTTFSAFSLEGFRMIEQGQWGIAAGYAAVSVIGSIAAVAAGYGMMRA